MLSKLFGTDFLTVWLFLVNMQEKQAKRTTVRYQQRIHLNGNCSKYKILGYIDVESKSCFLICIISIRYVEMSYVSDYIRNKFLICETWSIFLYLVHPLKVEVFRKCMINLELMLCN